MTIDTKTLAMMAALQSGKGFESLEPLLAESNDVSEQTKSLIQLLSTQQAGRPRHDDEAGWAGSQPTRRQQLLLKRSRRTIEKLEQQLEEAFEIIDQFSAAVGACTECFGDDPGCPECRGAGKPGWKVPVGKDFEWMIKPAAERYELAQRRRLPKPDSDH